MFKQPDGCCFASDPDPDAQRRHMAAMGQHEIWPWDCRSHRIIETAEINEGNRHECLQGVKHRIQRAQAHGQFKTLYCVFGASDKDASDAAIGPRHG